MHHFLGINDSILMWLSTELICLGFWGTTVNCLWETFISLVLLIWGSVFWCVCFYWLVFGKNGKFVCCIGGLCIIELIPQNLWEPTVTWCQKLVWISFLLFQSWEFVGAFLHTRISFRVCSLLPALVLQRKLADNWMGTSFSTIFDCSWSW